MGTFLIADDNPNKMQFLKSILKHAHWEGEVLEATNTDDAKRLIDEHPEIIAAFIDYQMPRENGPAVIRHLKEKIPAAGAALVSAGDNHKQRDEAKAAGADAYVCTSGQEEDVVAHLTGLLVEWREQNRP